MFKETRSFIAYLNEKLHTPTWLFVLLTIVLLLRIPSFFEPYSYGDEMIYLTLGEAIRRGIPLYSGVHDNKPPLLYVTAAIAGSLFWFKAILAVWHLITVFIFWKLSEVLFPAGKEVPEKLRSRNKKAQVISTAIFALLTTLPALEGNIANAELFMIGPTILAFLLLLTRKLTFRNLFFSGVLFSVSTLYKVPAAFDVPAIVFLWLATHKFNLKNLRLMIKKSFILALGFSAPIAITLIWYFLRGAFGEYIVAAYLQNFGYLSSWRPDDVQKSFLVKNGPLLMRAAVVSFGLLILYWKRKRLSKEYIFASAWLLLSLFAVTLSERPYPHYLIQSAAPLSLLLAKLFIFNNIEQVLSLIPLSIAFFVPYYYHFWHYPTLPYYSRFIKLATRQMDKNEYFSTFGGQVSRNYKIAEYIVSSTNKSDKVFIWGDSSPIYALSRRFPPMKYVADYHIKDFSSHEKVLYSLNSDMPTIIVVLPGSEVFPELDEFLRKNYGGMQTINDATIWRLLSPGVRALLSF